MMNKKEKARAIYEKMMLKDYCSQWMGIQPLELDEGYCKIKMKVTKEMLNGYGILHGGIAFAFADSAFAFASNSFGRIALSINGSMNYNKSASEGDEIIAIAKSLSVNYKIADFDVNVYNNDLSQVLYYFRGTVYRTSKEVLA